MARSPALATTGATRAECRDVTRHAMGG
jgi:hypothetical protein